MGLMNDYAREYPDFEKTPKAVIAAVAYSLAMMIEGESSDAASKLLRSEWQTLHRAGIVPQKPAQNGATS
jgi:hypothetical protein